MRKFDIVYVEASFFKSSHIYSISSSVYHKVLPDIIDYSDYIPGLEMPILYRLSVLKRIQTTDRALF